MEEPQKEGNEKTNDQSVGTKNVGSGTMDAFGVDNKPSARMESRELADKLYREFAPSSGQGKYAHSSDEEKEAMFESFLRTIEKKAPLLRESLDARTTASLRELIVNGKYDLSRLQKVL